MTRMTARTFTPNCSNFTTFVPLMVEPAATPKPVGTIAEADTIKIEIAGAVLHEASECSRIVQRPWRLR